MFHKMKNFDLKKWFFFLFISLTETQLPQINILYTSSTRNNYYFTYTCMQWYLCIYLGSSVMYFKIHLVSFYTTYFWWPITLQDWKIYECRYAKLVKMSLSITSLTTKKCLNIWFSLLKPAWQSYEKGFTLLLLLNK